MMAPDEHTPEIGVDASGEFIIYRTEDERTEVHLRLVDGTVWMVQEEIAELFGISTATVSIHLKNIYEDTELTRDRTLKQFQRVRSEGDRDIRRSLNHYNLEAIMAVGYRVRSPRGVQFRRWATEVLKEYLVKGFALNDEKLKDPRGSDYFDELLSRIRDIRSSEKRLYKQLRDVFSLAVDYDDLDEQTKIRFFQMIQNKLHYAIVGQTSSEIIATRSDPTKDNMGLTTFAGKKVTKKDVDIAKNYLEKNELEELNLLVSQFLDYAEMQARRRKLIHLSDWEEKADNFIEFNEYETLRDAGRITADRAKELAKERYSLFVGKRRIKEDEEFGELILGEMRKVEQQLLEDRQRLAPRKKD